MVGTGKYRDNRVMARAIEASGAEIVTVAVRRVDLDRTKEEGVLYHLSSEEYFLLANTAGCYSADEAVRYPGSRGRPDSTSSSSSRSSEIGKPCSPIPRDSSAPLGRWPRRDLRCWPTPTTT